jgi:hypothetical protein
MDARGFCKFFRPINAKCRGIAGLTCRTRAAHSPPTATARLILFRDFAAAAQIRTGKDFARRHS